MKVQLHPVHMMFVHFPAALLPLDLILLGASAYYRNPILSDTAYYCLLCGVIGGWVAVLTGLYDFFIHALKQGPAALTAGMLHGIVQAIMITGFTIVLALEYKNPEYIHHHPIGLWIAKGILILILLFGNYLGGDLVLRHVSKQFNSLQSS